MEDRSGAVFKDEVSGFEAVSPGSDDVAVLFCFGEGAVVVLNREAEVSTRTDDAAALLEQADAAGVPREIAGRLRLQDAVVKRVINMQLIIYPNCIDVDDELRAEVIDHELL